MAYNSTPEAFEQQNNGIKPRLESWFVHRESLSFAMLKMATAYAKRYKQRTWLPLLVSDHFQATARKQRIHRPAFDLRTISLCCGEI